MYTGLSNGGPLQESEEAIMARMHLLDMQIANMKQEIMEEESNDVIPNEDVDMSEEDEEDEEEKGEEKNAIASIDGTRDYAPNKDVDYVLPVNQRGLKDSELVDYLKRAEIVPMMPKQWDSNISTTPSLHIPVKTGELGELLQGGEPVKMESMMADNFCLEMADMIKFETEVSTHPTLENGKDKNGTEKRGNNDLSVELKNVTNLNDKMATVLQPREGGPDRQETEKKKTKDSIKLEEGVRKSKGSNLKFKSPANKENRSPPSPLKFTKKTPVLPSKFNVVPKLNEGPKIKMASKAPNKFNVGPKKTASKWAKAVYVPHACLPLGWTFYDNEKGQVFFRNAGGKFIKNRRYALQEMLLAGGPLDAQGGNSKFTAREISFIRDGLTYEGWRYAEPEGRLPFGWLYKTYSHRIEGVDTDVMYLLSPNGSIVRSKARLKKEFEQLGVSEADLRKLLEFKPDEFKGPDDGKTLENPDDQWVYDPEVVPEGWLVKKYTFNSSYSKKVEEVFHYLTPCKKILRGRRQVFDYMSMTGTYSTEAFNKFPFNREAAAKAAKEVSLVKWENWEDAMGLPDGWKVRCGEYQSTQQKKKQYKSPLDQIFPSKFQVMRYLREGGEVAQASFSHRAQRQKKRRKSAAWGAGTVWAEWRTDDIPCLPGWQFSVGREDNRRKIRYKSPEDRVFHSRGPLIRYLYENNLKKKQQLKTLKRLLKTNQGLRFEESRRNDRFIKHLDVDWNFMLYLRQRYDNHVDVQESIDPKLPEGWRVKNINGVEYFKVVDEEGPHVFNTRRMVVTYLRQRKTGVADEDLMEILEESDAESELTESEEEGDASGDEDEKQEVVEEEKKPLQAEDLADAQLWREELEGEGEAPGWKRTLSVKQEALDYRTDSGWLDQWQAKEEMNNSFLIKQEPRRRRQIGV